MAYAQPVAYAPMQQSMVPGMDFLQGVDGLFVEKKLELLEAVSGCEGKNRYNITLIPKGLPDPLPKETLNQIKAGAQYAPLLKAKENSKCMERICCPMVRSFTMPFVDGNQSQFFHLERPFKCTIMYQGCCILNAQEMFIKDASGNLVASAIEENKCGWCCTRSFAAKDAAGRTLYHVRAGECQSSRGCNCFAPSCCNERYSLDVYDADEKAVVTVAESIFPGCNLKGCTGLTNYNMRFPESADVKQRAALLAAYFLIEFAVFEWKQSENN